MYGVRVQQGWPRVVVVVVEDNDCYLVMVIVVLWVMVGDDIR